MKNIFFASLAVLSLAVSSAALHADTFDLTLKTGATVDALSGPTNVVFDGVNALEFTYSNTTACVIGLGGCNSVLGTSTSVFTVIYAAVNPNLAVLNVNDVCTQAVVLGSAPGCQSFAFSATNVKLGSGAIGVGAVTDILALADVNVGVGLASLNIDGIQDGPQLLGADVQGVSDQFNFTPQAATPEPSSLMLLATGALSTAGVIRRKLSSRA